MKLRALDLAVLEALEKGILVAINIKFGYIIEDIIASQSPNWKQTNLSKESILSQKVSLVYTTKLDQKKILFTVNITRKEWAMLTAAYEPKVERSSNSKCVGNLPSYKDHPYFKRRLKKPAGRFMKPVDSQAVKMYRKKFK